MSRAVVFVDGDVGTTGLRIRSWLERRSDFELLRLEERERKDPAARRRALGEADVAILCLPDEAAREAVAWAGPRTRLIDGSSAHRVAPGWVYGLPELGPGQRQAIREARFVSNPGCYPTGAILCLRPLIDAGLLQSSTPICVRGLSGYSGGGRGLIARYESEHPELLNLPADAPYSLTSLHKHLPEMTHYSGLSEAPQFVPSVGPFHSGLRIEIPLHVRLLPSGVSGKHVWEVLAQRYAGEPFVRVAPWVESQERDESRFDPRAFNDGNEIELSVLPHPGGHVWLMARFDNLGKGASGAAVQSLNLMLGVEETRGLRD